MPKIWQIGKKSSVHPTANSVSINKQRHIFHMSNLVSYKIDSTRDLAQEARD